MGYMQNTQLLSLLHLFFFQIHKQQISSIWLCLIVLSVTLKAGVQSVITLDLDV